MVNIQTTQRQFENIEPKVNSLEAYSRALMPSVEQAQKINYELNKVKINTFSTEARMKIDDINNQWQLENRADPTNPLAKKKLNDDMNVILSEYRDKIDPTMRLDWDQTSSSIKSAFNLSNQDWAVKRNFQNTKIFVADNIKNNLSLARSHGRSGNFAAGMADYVNSYSQILSYAQSSLGEVDGKELLKDYEKNYVTSYIVGQSEVDPYKALNLLNDEGFTRSLGDDAGKVKSMVKKQIAMNEFNKNYESTTTALGLSQKLDTMQPIDALQVLRDNEMNVSPKYFKAKERAILSNLGVNSVTRADTAVNLINMVNSFDQGNAKLNLEQISSALEDIEDEYAKGNLSLGDKRRLVNNINKVQRGALETIKENDEGYWFGFSYKEAWEKINTGVYKAPDKIMLDYYRAVSDGDYSVSEKKEALNKIISKYNDDMLTNIK